MRKQAYSVTLRNEYLLKRIKDIKAEHPFWGYRRVWAYLKYIDGLIVNKKRVYRLMREHNLTVKPNTRLIAKRVSERPKPRSDKPKQWWGIDKTKFMILKGHSKPYIRLSPKIILVIIIYIRKKLGGIYIGFYNRKRMDICNPTN